MTKATSDKNWLHWHQSPSKPSFQVPAGSVDAHCHVFGPAEEFPFAPGRKYTPCNASKNDLWNLRDHLGFSRNVIVQASCHGPDNRALVDALRHSDGKARGIAVINETVTDEELNEMNDAGVRGIRFNFVKRLVDVMSTKTMMNIANKVQKFNWHIVIYFEADDLTTVEPIISGLDTNIVIDHMGRPDVTKSPDGPEFAQFIRLMADNPNVWTKVSCPERLSHVGPPDYGDVIPFARKLVEMFPDRVLWGTDWPHPNMKSHMPDDGHLVDVIAKIAVDKELQEKLLVQNPMKLYWPEEIN